MTLLAGSRGDLGAHGDANAFYGDVHAVSFDPRSRAGAAALRGPPGTAPLHPSFEERPGAPDKVFASLDDLDYERQVRAWGRELARAGADRADVLHCTISSRSTRPRRAQRRRSVVGQLHGTELLMLERIANGAPPSWRHAERWASRLRPRGRSVARLVIVPAGVERARTVLEVPPERAVGLPNGVDVELSSRIRSTGTPSGDASWWRSRRGWLPGESPGSARYREPDVERLAGGSVLVYVGQFTAVKRLDRLIRAFARARQRLTKPVGLVLVGGHPGEWEDEHPAGSWLAWA